MMVIMMRGMRIQQINVASSSHRPYLGHCHLRPWSLWWRRWEGWEWCKGLTFMMVALNSRSAWSISALSLTLIFRLSLTGFRVKTRVDCFKVKSSTWSMQTRWWWKTLFPLYQSACSSWIKSRSKLQLSSFPPGCVPKSWYLKNNKIWKNSNSLNLTCHA